MLIASNYHSARFYNKDTTKASLENRLIFYRIYPPNPVNLNTVLRLYMFPWKYLCNPDIKLHSFIFLSMKTTSGKINKHERKGSYIKRQLQNDRFFEYTKEWMNQVGNLNRGIPTSFEQSSAETKKSNIRDRWNL